MLSLRQEMRSVNDRGPLAQWKLLEAAGLQDCVIMFRYAQSRMPSPRSSPVVVQANAKQPLTDGPR